MHDVVVDAICCDLDGGRDNHKKDIRPSWMADIALVTAAGDRGFIHGLMPTSTGGPTDHPADSNAREAVAEPTMISHRTLHFASRRGRVISKQHPET